MLIIRFSRIGKKKKAFYRIIISEKSKDTHGTYLELLGHYNPHTKAVVLKKDRITYWLERGAMTSNSIFNLLVTQGVIKSETKRKSVFLSKKRKEKLAGQKAEAATKIEPAAKPAEQPKQESA
ncbi:MAG: 30S ribosomal protein S16 [Patescibacteria group bacterium]